MQLEIQSPILSISGKSYRMGAMILFSDWFLYLFAQFSSNRNVVGAVDVDIYNFFHYWYKYQSIYCLNFNIKQLKYVKSIDVNSNENKLNKYNDMLSKYNLDTEYNATIFNNSFYVKFEFESKDLANIKEIQNNLINEIRNIKEVERIENSRFNHFINVYNDKGTDGLKSICKFYEETDNMDSKEILKYYEDNQDFVNEYRKYLY